MTFPDLHHRMCCDECDVMRDRLPDYLAAVEALERLADQVERWGEHEIVHEPLSLVQARTALARLRDEVPA